MQPVCPLQSSAAFSQMLDCGTVCLALFGQACHIVLQPTSWEAVGGRGQRGQEARPLNSRLSAPEAQATPVVLYPRLTQPITGVLGRRFPTRLGAAWAGGPQAETAMLFPRPSWCIAAACHSLHSLGETGVMGSWWESQGCTLSPSQPFLGSIIPREVQCK